MDKEKYTIVSFSGGKDSTAMLLRMMELKEPIDEVISCDTYKEFPQMYEHIERIKRLVESNGIKFTQLRNPLSFDYWLLEHKPNRRNPDKFREQYGDVSGYSWATSRVRWCTTILKTQVIDKYLKELKEQFNVVECVGIAADETKRINRENNQAKRLPLVEWGWSEADCLNYCYALGYDWGGLYNYFDRVSCWCCPLQSLDDLRNLRTHFPQLWDELKDMDKRTWRKFRADYSVEELDIRFKFEEQKIAMGESIRSRAFYKELKEVLSNGQY